MLCDDGIVWPTKRRKGKGDDHGGDGCAGAEKKEVETGKRREEIS